MYRNYKINVVIPAYNEETQISRVIDSMPDFVDHMVIVNDCSQDATAKVIRSHPVYCAGRIELIEHIKNLGAGGAVATGCKWSRDSECDIVVVMDGDGQMDPADMPNLLDPLIDGIVDCSKGNRLVVDDAFRKIPKVRFFGNAILSLLTKIASGYWAIADSQSGYKAINRSVLLGIDWDNMYKGYGHPNDFLVRLNVLGVRVMDVPIKAVYNIGEKSGIKIHKVIFGIGSLLTRLFFWRLKEKYIIRDFHPLVFFYFLGFFSFAIGTVLFIRMLLLWWQNGTIPEITFIGWMFSLTFGFNSFFFSMWFDYEANRHLNPPLIHLGIKNQVSKY